MSVRRAPDPRFRPAYGRTGRLPLTLIDGSTRDSIARDLRVMAAAVHFRRPCYAQFLQRLASQVADSFTAAQAVAGYTDQPSWNTSLTESTLNEGTVTEITLIEPEPPQ